LIRELTDAPTLVSPASAGLSEPLELADDRRVIAGSQSDLRTLWLLEPYLELVRRGPPSEYALTRSSFGRGIEAGGSASELRQLLERGSGAPLPLGIQQAIDRWNARAGRYRIRPAVLFEADDESELDDALARLASSGLVRERLGPRAATVTAGRAGELASALERLGHLPRLDPGLRLMAGRGAHASLVDAHTIAALLWAIRFVRTLDPALTLDLPEPDRLARRLEEALGGVTGPRISRRARAAARRLRPALAEPGRIEGLARIADDIPDPA
jgi:hypothetical protein